MTDRDPETGQFKEGNQAGRTHGLGYVRQWGTNQAPLARPATFAAVLEDIGTDIGVKAAMQANAAAGHTAVVALQKYIQDQLQDGVDLVDIQWAVNLLLRALGTSDRTLKSWREAMPEDVDSEYQAELDRIKQAVQVVGHDS